MVQVTTGAIKTLINDQPDACAIASAMGAMMAGWAGMVVNRPITVAIAAMMPKFSPSWPWCSGTFVSRNSAIRLPTPVWVATPPRPMTPARNNSGVKSMSLPRAEGGSIPIRGATQTNAAPRDTQAGEMPCNVSVIQRTSATATISNSRTSSSFQGVAATHCSRAAGVSLNMNDNSAGYRISAPTAITGKFNTK